MSENQEKQPQQVRIAVLPAPEMKTLYTNAFQTNIAQGELLLTASVSRQEKDDKGPFLSLQPQAAALQAPFFRPCSSTTSALLPVRNRVPKTSSVQ